MEGLILSLPAMGIMVSFRLFNTPDLTPDGTFTLGACITAVLVSLGAPLPLVFLIVALSCGLVGAFNRFISYSLNIHPLLAGIIVLTMLFSVYFRIMGTSNIALFEYNMLFAKTDEYFGNYAIALAACLMTFTGLHLYFKTNSGLVFRAMGQTPELGKGYGFSHLKFSLLAGTLTSTLTGISGSLMAQSQEFVDVNMGIGILVQALASMMIGEVIIGAHTLFRQLLAPAIGALIYQFIASFIISLGLPSTDLKLMTGVIVITVIGLRRYTGRD